MTRDEADAALHAAIEEHARAYDLADPDDLLDDFAVVAHWVGGSSTHYTTAYRTDTVPDHVARGLFRVGEALVEE